MKLYNSTGDTTTTTGTGALTGAGTAPSTSYQTPAAAGIVNGDVIAIRIEDGTAWEVCESTVTESSGVYTYSRGTLRSSSTGSRINFSAGTKNIYVVAPSSEIEWRHELVEVGTNTNDLSIDVNTKVLLLRGTANCNVTGIAGGSASRTLILYNDSSSYTVTIPASDTGSAAENRFIEALSLTPGAQAVVTYLAGNGWRPILIGKHRITEAEFNFTDNTTGNATTSAHGLMPKLSTDTTKWVRSDGSHVALPGRLLSVSVLTSTSSSTYTTPANCNKILIRAIGGGGAGGSADGGSGTSGVGGGGGGGAYIEKFVAVSPSTGYTYQCGAGGTAGAAGNTSGGNGSDTTIVIGATTYRAYGGGGGTSMATGTTAAIATGGPGGGGPSHNADFQLYGDRGLAGYRFSASILIPGHGGPGPFGGSETPLSVTSANGTAGNNYGSGGSGGVANTTTDRQGGAGANGLIIIMEYA